MSCRHNFENRSQLGGSVSVRFASIIFLAELNLIVLKLTSPQLTLSSVTSNLLKHPISLISYEITFQIMELSPLALSSAQK